MVTSSKKFVTIRSDRPTSKRKKYGTSSSRLFAAYVHSIFVVSCIEI